MPDFKVLITDTVEYAVTIKGVPDAKAAKEKALDLHLNEDPGTHPDITNCGVVDRTFDVEDMAGNPCDEEE